MYTRKTRKLKQKQYEMYLNYLKKQKGGRLEYINTFRSACSPEDASTKIKVIKTIKSPEEGDDYIHVLKSDHDVIVKIQEPGPLVISELKIHNHLLGSNNVINYICEFTCLLDISWNKPIENPCYLCDNNGEVKHILVMEYINNDLANFLQTNDYDNKVFESLVKQAGFALLDFHLNKGVCHNDINRGNILLQIDNTVKELTYKFYMKDHVVNTYGYEVIYIDFQRGYILGNDNNNNNSDTNNLLYPTNKFRPSRFSTARDELTTLYHLMSIWTPRHSTRLKELTNAVFNSKNEDELVGCISMFSTAA